MRASFVFSEVITGLRRNITMTIAMVLTTDVSLAMLGGGLILVNMIGQMQQNYYSKAEVTVYLTDSVSASDSTCSSDVCQGLRSSLENNPTVKSVSFESRAHGYQRFQKLFSSQPELLKLTREKAIPAALHVNMNNPARANALVAQYSGKPGVKNVGNQKKYLDKIFHALSTARNVVFGIALVQALAALLLMSNTIQLSAFTRRKEVGIMRLVGATRWYTQLPFLLEAVVAGVVGAAIAIGALFGLGLGVLGSALSGAVRANLLPAVTAGDIFTVSPWLMVVAIVISAVTGYGTLRLYVRL
jgi:cell division transport system permease protein